MLKLITFRGKILKELLRNVGVEGLEYWDSNIEEINLKDLTLFYP